MKIFVTTQNGHHAELSTTSEAGVITARAVAFWRGVRTPAIELATFTDELAAVRYLRRLAAALIDQDPEEVS